MQKISPFLWFDGRAEEATRFYVSVFKDSKIIEINHWGANSGFPQEQVMTATFELDGVQFHAFDAGPQFKFNEAISFSVDCADQAEVDHYWEQLTSGGGEESMCGWLKDRFGVSWQIVPRVLPQMMKDKDPAKAARVMKAMMKMKKIIVADIEKAYAGN